LSFNQNYPLVGLETAINLKKRNSLWDYVKWHRKWIEDNILPKKHNISKNIGSRTFCFSSKTFCEKGLRNQKR